MILSKKGLEIKPSPTLEIDTLAKKMKKQGIDIISFGAGEPDFDTPDYIKKAAIEAIQSGFTKYTPASGTLELKQVICNKLKKDNDLEYVPANIVVSNGAKHSLLNAFQAICNPGDEIILFSPYWVSYPEIIKLAGAIPVMVNMDAKNNFKMNVKQIQAQITDKTKAILINSPNNPSGQVYERADLEKIATLAIEHDLFIISDEIYEKFLYEDYTHVSIASLNEKIKNNTILVNGVSKTYAMTGWRIGYTASNTAIAKIMSNIQSHETANPNSIAQKAAEAAISGDQSLIHEMITQFVSRRNYIVERIQSIQYLSCIVPNGAFYLMVNISQLIGKSIDGITILNADVFAKAMLEKVNVAVVPCTGFGVTGYIRLSYAIKLENIKIGLDRIEAFLQKVDDNDIV
ncbi:pyridoxal phosphate-dependent aminotransferase [Propionispira raffinosivorans]|uniref:pyridoxal phosphate-dependent aminotransferase n=1 Tax=Propionispira raffinosivorans TaxID=86959 RepID=UPI000369E72D|nr:pyridoxal phosphate-dependent aminotransferase [Propionispira raffinosivorans]